MAGGKFSEANLFGITLRESANDGSDFTNPDADFRRVFLGEDGEFHKKDSAGAVTGFAGSGIASTIVDAKGDLITASAADTPVRKAVGTNGTTLIADSAQSDGLRWGSRETVYDHLTADEAGATTATLADTGLSFAVLNGVYYKFKFDLIYRSTVTTVGIKLALTTPTFTVFTAWVRINVISAASASGVYDGSLQASGDSVIAANVTATNTDYPAVVEGNILPSADGTLMLQYAAETTGATVTLRRASAAELVILG